jgi:transposase
VRASAHGGQVGYDTAKKTKGRKRFLLVDILGLLLGVTIKPADCPERKGARTLLVGALRTFGWLMHCPRLVRDHEQTAASAAGWIYLAMIRLMLRQLA